MDIKERMKLCPFCEGRISWNAQKCRYCNSLLEEKEEDNYGKSSSDLYDPPYSPDKGIPRFSSRESSYVENDGGFFSDSSMEGGCDRGEYVDNTKQSNAHHMREKTQKSTEEDAHLSVTSILLLSVGGQLFTLSWFLFFCSDNGKVCLEWKSCYWPIYLGVSLVCFFQGLKKLFLISRK